VFAVSDNTIFVVFSVRGGKYGKFYSKDGAKKNSAYINLGYMISTTYFLITT
jgi:hypothetical protein